MQFSHSGKNLGQHNSILLIKKGQFHAKDQITKDKSILLIPNLKSGFATVEI